MSINRTSSLKSMSAIQPRRVTDAPITNTQAVKTTAPTSTSAMLSDAQVKLIQPDDNDINLGRVETLRLAIHSGELKMGTGKIIDALISEAQQDLQSNRSYDVSCRDP